MLVEFPSWKIDRISRTKNMEVDIIPKFASIAMPNDNLDPGDRAKKVLVDCLPGLSTKKKKKKI